jgi:Cof subfamily protein (haloacid dehalogenase superfamily)
MWPIRLVALDLDDTLLRTDLNISYRTRRAVKRCAAAGVRIVLASGRTYENLRRYAKLLALDKGSNYLICDNGSMIHDAADGNVVYQVTIPARPALAAFDLVDAEGFAVQICGSDMLYVSRENEFALYEKKLTGMEQTVALDFRDMVAEGCHKMIIPGDPVMLRPLETLLRNIVGDELTIFTSKPYYLEILPPTADKGTALERVAGMLGVEREAVMAIGDSMNDEAMIRWAGFGVAMLNGDERVKQIARIITERTNDDDGVAGVLEQYVLKNAK